MMKKKKKTYTSLFNVCLLKSFFFICLFVKTMAAQTLRVAHSRSDGVEGDMLEHYLLGC